MTRVIAYCLHYREGMDLSPGVCRPDEPAISILDDHGRHRQWIEVGNPSVERLKRAARASEEVWIYSHRGTTQWLRGFSPAELRGSAAVSVVAMPESFLATLGEHLARRNRWALVHTDGLLHLTIDEVTLEATLIRHGSDPAPTPGRA